MKSAPGIAFDYAPSRWLIGVASLLVACAAAAPWLAQIPLALRVLISIGAAVYGAIRLWRFGHPRFRRIARDEAGWSLIDSAGDRQAAILGHHARLGAWLALGFRHGPRARFHAVIGPDNIDVDTRRRLILLLSRADANQIGEIRD